MGLLGALVLLLAEFATVEGRDMLRCYHADTERYERLGFWTEVSEPLSYNEGPPITYLSCLSRLNYRQIVMYYSKCNAQAVSFWCPNLRLAVASAGLIPYSFHDSIFRWTQASSTFRHGFDSITSKILPHTVLLVHGRLSRFLSLRLRRTGRTLELPTTNIYVQYLVPLLGNTLSMASIWRPSSTLFQPNRYASKTLSSDKVLNPF